MQYTWRIVKLCPYLDKKMWVPSSIIKHTARYEWIRYTYRKINQVNKIIVLWKFDINFRFFNCKIFFYFFLLVSNICNDFQFPESDSVTDMLPRKMINCCPNMPSQKKRLFYYRKYEQEDKKLIDFIATILELLVTRKMKESHIKQTKTKLKKKTFCT